MPETFFIKVAGLRLFTMINKSGLNISRSSAIFQDDLPDVFIKLRKLPRSLRPATLLKKSLWHRCFPKNFAKFLRTPFLQNTSGRLLLSHTEVFFKRAVVKKFTKFIGKHLLQNHVFNKVTGLRPATLSKQV